MNRKQREDRNTDICLYFIEQEKRRKNQRCEIISEIALFHKLSETMVRKILMDGGLL